MTRTRRSLALGLAVAALALRPGIATGAGDPSLADQWGLAQIRASEAWPRTTGEGVRIGIVDTGVDLAHEDLAGQVVAHTACLDTEGYAAQCKGSASDDHGHGTHVSGIAAALAGNDRGIAGVAPGAKLVVAKAFDETGAASRDDVLAAIRWVVDQGARVVNLSLGDALFVTSSVFGTGLAEGIDYAWNHGAIPVIASGNEDVLGLGIGSADYGELNAVVVGATGPDGRVTGYSSPTGNAKWALVAPGGAGAGAKEDDVLSTYWVAGERNQYAFLAGTSMASPHVSAALALLLAQGLDQRQAVDRLLASVDTSQGCGPNSPTCRGRLDVARATAAR